MPSASSTTPPEPGGGKVTISVAPGVRPRAACARLRPVGAPGRPRRARRRRAGRRRRWRRATASAVEGAPRRARPIGSSVRARSRCTMRKSGAGTAAVAVEEDGAQAGIGGEQRRACVSICSRRCGASSSAKPSRASRIAGARTSASGRRPNAAWSATQPATSPGTPTARPPRRRRSGRGCPWSKKRSGVARARARARGSRAHTRRRSRGGPARSRRRRCRTTTDARRSPWRPRRSRRRPRCRRAAAPPRRPRRRGDARPRRRRVRACGARARARAAAARTSTTARGTRRTYRAASGCGKRLPPRRACGKGASSDGEAAREARGARAVRGEGILPRGVSRAQRARSPSRPPRSRRARRSSRSPRRSARSCATTRRCVVWWPRTSCRTPSAGCWRRSDARRHGRKRAAARGDGRAAGASRRRCCACRSASSTLPQHGARPAQRALVAPARRAASACSAVGGFAVLPAPSDGARDRARACPRWCWSIRDGGLDAARRRACRSSTRTCSRRCSSRARRSGAGSATAARCWSSVRAGARGRRRAGEPLPARRRRRTSCSATPARARSSPRATTRASGRSRSTSSSRRSACSSADSARACSSCARPTRSREVLGAGFGVTVCGRHLAGVAGAADGAVRRGARGRDRRALHHQPLQGGGPRRPAGRTHASTKREALGLDYVFACTRRRARAAVLRAPGLRARRARRRAGEQVDGLRRAPPPAASRPFACALPARAVGRGARVVSGWLRGLGTVVLVLGARPPRRSPDGTSTGDTAFAEAAAAYERHPEHPLFQVDYYARGASGTTG